MGQPKLSGGTPDTSWSVLQNHHLGNDLPNLYKIATNLKYVTLGRSQKKGIMWEFYRKYYAEGLKILFEHLIMITYH